MKIFIIFTLLVGIAFALESTGLEGRAAPRRPHKPTYRPKKSGDVGTFRAPNKPAKAPADFKTGLARATVQKSKATLKRVPADLIDPATRRRRDSLQVLRQLRRQVKAADFYECANANPRPSSADCGVIIDQVLDSGDDLLVAANSCLVFSYRTCQGFFCSLCSTLATSTDFIGNQLDTVDILCGSNNQIGTIVGEDAPQWDVGFTYAGASLPTYDVC